MKPSTRRSLLIVLGGLLVAGLIMTLLRGDARGAHDIALAIFALVIMAGFALVVWWVRTLPRRDAAEASARDLGLRYAGNDEFGLIDLPFPLLRRPATVRGLEHVSVGRWQGSEVTIFEYWYARSSNPSRNDVERFSCVVTSLPEWWPDLVIAPETLTTRAMGHLTMNEVDVESEAFNRSFAVRSGDPRFANALLDARMIQWLLDRSGPWGFEIAGGLLLCSRTPAFQPWELRPLLDTAVGFLETVPTVVSNVFRHGPARVPQRPD
jgi:hypothetical protein